MVFKPGYRIDSRYEIRREVGRGGMGIVYEATHLRLEQRVAIKVLTAARAAREEDLARFRREGRTAATLTSAHVVRTLDVDVTREGYPFLVFEFVDGQSLAQLDQGARAQGKTLSMAEIVHYLYEVAEALDEAHALGLVHRDVKPENILVARRANGTGSIAKLCDFGIAKTMDGSQDITSASRTMGTPRYMSPEQIQNKPLDSRSDVYSLAVAFYRLVSGHYPFRGDDAAGYSLAVLTDRPTRLSTYLPDISPAVEAVVHDALSQNVAKRPPSASAFVDGLMSELALEHDEELATGEGAVPASLRSSAPQSTRREGVPISQRRAPPTEAPAKSSRVGFGAVLGVAGTVALLAAGVAALFHLRTSGGSESARIPATGATVAASSINATLGTTEPTSPPGGLPAASRTLPGSNGTGAAPRATGAKNGPGASGSTHPTASASGAGTGSGRPPSWNVPL